MGTLYLCYSLYVAPTQCVMLESIVNLACVACHPCFSKQLLKINQHALLALRHMTVQHLHKLFKHTIHSTILH